MKHGARCLAVVAALVLGAAAAGQGPIPDAETLTEVPDVPPGDGAIRGRVLRKGDAEAAGGVPVVLYALGSGGEAGLRQTSTDERGAFAFEGVATDPDTAYLVGTRFAGVPFAERTTFAPGETEKRLELFVSEATADTSSAETSSVRLRFERGCEQLSVTESIELRNPTDRVIHVPPNARVGATPVFAAHLPEGASQLQLPVGDLDRSLERDGASLAYWGPLYPGTQELRYAYALAAAPGTTTVERAFPTGAERVELFAPRAGPRIVGEKLRRSPPIRVEGREFVAFAVADIARGESLRFALELEPTPELDDRLTVEGSQLWLELDDAALSVDEQLRLAVSGSSPLEARDGAPILCLALPDAARDYRFSSQSLALGISADPSGALAVRGPVPPGESSLTVRYRIPVEGDAVELLRSLPRAVPILSIFIADTGLDVETQQLHRRRPVRSNGRTYLHLEGFEIDAGEEIALRLTRLPPRGARSRAVTAAFLVLAALASVAFLAGPLRSRSEAAADHEAPEVAEREALYAAMRDLDEDFETGKLSPDDHADLRAELRARAASLLRAERDDAAARHTSEPAAPPACPGCGAATPAEARFCPQCGTALAEVANRGTGG